MKNTKKKQAQAGQKAANGGFSIEEEPISKPEENNLPADTNVCTIILIIRLRTLN